MEDVTKSKVWDREYHILLKTHYKLIQSNVNVGNLAKTPKLIIENFFLIEKQYDLSSPFLLFFFL